MWPFTNENFSSIMSNRRFELLLQFLHVSPPTTETNDKLHKIRPILDRVIKNFMAAYTPNINISIDESIIAFKGRLSWIQYMPKKPHKWGMKAWVLADSSNGYVWKWELYTGKQEREDGVGLSHQVVMSLSRPLQHKGYHLYCDNFYSSPALFEELSKVGFLACGTVRSNRRGLSEVFKTKKLRRGDVYSEKVGQVLCLKWKDKRDVLLLSTIHDDVAMVDILRRSRTVAGGIERIQKPKVIDDYNQHMGGVDQSDQLVMYYGYAHQQTKWWKRVLFHLVDLLLVNASILYNSVNEKKLTQMEFRIEVAKGLLKGYTKHQPKHFTVSRDLPLRLTERPFPERIPSDCPYGGRLLCDVCRVRGDKRSRTQYRCKVCKVALHVECFEAYHTKLDYSK